MNKVASADGTMIVYDRLGSGPPVVLVGSGPTDRSANMALAELLAEGLTVFNYDRRGRGDSGDTAPFAVDREFDDLAAVIGAAGGTAAVFGTSGGAIIAFQAAGRGLSINRIIGWEPPYIVPDSRPAVPADYQDQLRALLAEDRCGDMVELFLTKAAGIPAEFVAQIRQFPGWSASEAVAHALVYDAMLTGDFSVPEKLLTSLTLPVLILDGGTTPWMTQTADVVGALLPNGSRQTLAGQQHNVEPEAIAPAILEFVGKG